jgi:hypothetical protein
VCAAQQACDHFEFKNENAIQKQLTGVLRL